MARRYYYYAELNDNYIVDAIIKTTRYIQPTDKIIQIDSYDETLLNKMYINGEFVDVPEDEENEE